MTDTLLAITGIGLPSWSSRGATMTLEPIDQSKQVKRTINGELQDLSLAIFRKYRANISCTDANSPAFDANWPGKSLTVDCVPELSYLTAGGAPARTIVTGSSRVEGDYTFYRPRLTMRLTAWNVSRDEYGAVSSWSMDLEEV